MCQADLSRESQDNWLSALIRNNLDERSLPRLPSRIQCGGKAIQAAPAVTTTAVAIQQPHSLRQAHISRNNLGHHETQLRNGICDEED